MFFRSLTMYRFPSSINKSLDMLDARLAERQLKPVGPLELNSHGFVPPLGRGAEALSHRVGECIWITLGGEQRILPAAVVSQATAAKVAELEQREGRQIGGRERQRLRGDVLHELLPRAFVRPVRTNAYIDLEHGFIAVDSSSRKSAENPVSELRCALGSFPALPLDAEVSARAVLTGWIAGEPLPDGLQLGGEAELRDPVERGGRVRVTDLELRSDEITKHLESGKQCTRLALTLDEHLSFVIGEDLVVRKLKFLDGAVDQLENTERDSIEAELDARFALMSAELKRLFVLMEREFTAEQTVAQKSAGPAQGDIVGRILLRCPKCEREMHVDREPTDYPEAVRVEVQCPDCNAGDFDESMQFDAEGRHITRDPDEPPNY